MTSLNSGTIQTFGRCHQFSARVIKSGGDYQHVSFNQQADLQTSAKMTITCKPSIMTRSRNDQIMTRLLKK
jgi:hypothetical protein